MWSPDESLLAYYKNHKGPEIIHLNQTNAEVQSIPQIPEFDEDGVAFVASSWSSDGGHLEASVWNQEADIWVLTLNEERE